VNKIIHSTKELKWFYDNVVQELKSSEVHFLSLSARNKYLTDEERKTYALGRSEMFARSIVRFNGWEKFLSIVRKYETNEGAYITKNNMNMPSKAMVCYFNINPSDSLKAYRDFNKVMNEYMFELAQCAVNNRSTDNILYRINKQSTLLMNSYQKATGTRYWMDFDFDVDKGFLPYIEKIVAEVKSHNGRSYIIDTKSGFHLLISKDTFFSGDFNPKTIVDDAIEDLFNFYSKVYKDEFLTTRLAESEIMHNKNVMAPLPGTFQAGHKVIILNKGA